MKEQMIKVIDSIGVAFEQKMNKKKSIDEVVSLISQEDLVKNDSSVVNENHEKSEVDRKLYYEQLSMTTNLDTDQLMDPLRKMNANWNNLAYRTIRSHRKRIGRFIIFGKKIVRKLLSWYITPITEQQTEFNAATAQMSNDVRNKLIVIEDNFNIMQHNHFGIEHMVNERGNELANQLQEVEAKIKNIESNSISIIECRKELESKNISIDKKNKELEILYNKLSIINNDLELKNEMILLNNTSIEEKNRELEKNSKKLEEKNKELEKNSRKLEEKNKELEKNSRKLEEKNREIYSLNSLVKEKNSQLDLQSNYYNTIAKKLENLERDLTLLNKKSQSEEQEIEKTIVKVQFNLENLSEQLKETKNIVEEKVTKFESNNNKLTTQYFDSINKYQESIALISGSIAKLEEDFEESKDDNNLKLMEITTQNKENFDNKLLTIESDVSNLEKSLYHLSRYVDVNNIGERG